jgi:oligoendopeptidase F
MAKTAAANKLPTWDLTDLYPGTDAPELTRDLDAAARDAKAFSKRYAGKVAALSGADLGKAIAAYERIDETLSKAGSYAGLVHATAMEDPEIGRFYQTVQERLTEISTGLLFFGLEINQIKDAALERKLKDPVAARYRPWIRDSRIFRPHQLSEEMEKLLHEKSTTSYSAWVRLYDETSAGLRFRFGGKDVTMAEVLAGLTDRDGAKRRAAAKALSKGLKGNIRLFSLVTNTLAKDKEIADRWRHYARPISSRNLANRVEDEVVDALVGAVQGSYERLSHRYYRLKARWFGVKQLPYWDRNAPLPDDADRKIPWDEAKTLVLSSYRRFSPDLAEIGQRFFDNPWIDAPVKPGKASGAFAHPTVPSAHPYLLLNYQGRTRDVMTLAHELGHGVHQVLAAGQGQLLCDTPLTLAETASVFGEMLTFRGLLDAETNPRRRRVLLASKVEDMLNTVVRQVALHSFEAQVHDERRSGELTPDRLGEIWMEAQRASLGPAIRFDDDYRVFWAYIPHFIHSPFYVYAYAFGDCLVNSLYAVYQDAHEGFAGRYLDMLKAGGTLRHKELLAPFGLDASDSAFWSKGLSVVEGFIDELEKLEDAKRATRR